MAMDFSSADDGAGTLDLNSIFIGRQTQLDLFEIYLERWLRFMSSEGAERCEAMAF